MDDVIILVAYGEPTYDEYGNEDPGEKTKQVFCQVGSVSRSEFYQAAQNSLRPEITFTLSNFWDYEGQKVIRHKDRAGITHEYDVIRTYRTPGSDSLEITCEERVGNGKRD